MATPPKTDESAFDGAVRQLIELLGHSGGFIQEWEDGPYEPFRDRDFSHDQYLDSVRAVEAGPGGVEGLPALVQRMRRIAFSIFTYRHKGVTSLLFDLMMNPSTNLAEPPLTIAHVDIDELNTLFATRNVKTMLQSKIGISHVWGGIDVAVNGVNVAALAARGALTFATPISALATWLGDLANAVRIYENELEKAKAAGSLTAAARRQLMVQALNGTVGKGDLLGDFDGIAIGNHWARSPHAFTASAFLQEYYDNDTLAFNLAARLGRPSAAYRFHYFLKYAEPRLPSGGLDSSPFVATFDKAAAQEVVPRLVARAADDMLKVARIKASMGSAGPEFYLSNEPSAVASRRPTEQRLEALGGIDAFRWMCDKFCQFVDDGVRTGDGVWPPAP
jgi:hypothetical protein